MKCSRIISTVAALFLLSMTISMLHAEVGGRPYRITDYLAEEAIASVTFAPDGQALAFTRRRAANTQNVSGLVIEETRDDVWLQAGPGKPVQRLTDGHSDSSGWWLPTWSPDGKRLAMLSSRGGQVQIWVWERASGALRVVTRSGVDYLDHFAWVDSRRLLYGAMPEGVPATAMGRGGYHAGFLADRIEAAWGKARRGEVTASTVNSLEFPLPVRRLMTVDLATGAESLIGEATTAYGREDFWIHSELSPDRRAVWLQRPERARYPSTERLALGLPGVVELRLLGGQLIPLERPLPGNIVTTSIRWSPDGTELAFFALEDRLVHPELYVSGAPYVVGHLGVASKEYPGELWRVNVRTGRVEKWPTGDLDLGRGTVPFAETSDVIKDDSITMFWTGEQDLLVHAPRRSLRPAPDVMAKPEWLVLARDGSVRASSERLRAGFAADDSKVGRRPFEQKMKSLHPQASLVSLSPDGRSAIYRADTRDGLFLWRLGKNGDADALVTTNTFERQIAKPHERIVEYRDLSGKARKAKLVLPYGYVEGRKVPLVLEANQITDDIAAKAGTGHYSISDSSARARAVRVEFAAAGFAYLYPSMPLDGMGEEPEGGQQRNNLLSVTDGILPAVDAVIRQEIADPERLFLYGASATGFSVISLVTQTSRFKAGVAEIIYADPSTAGSEVGMDRRYSDNPFDNGFIGNFKDSRLSKLPAWRGGDHLRRNNPLTYVDRVQTPIMLVNGDLDHVFMQNTERFFAALVQQRKPAQFVRYWGEAHGQLSPVNLLDKWQRVFAWFDDHGDISRDARGNLVFEGDRVKSRNGMPALKPENYAKFDIFGPGGEAGNREWTSWRSTAAIP